MEGFNVTAIGPDVINVLRRPCKIRKMKPKSKIDKIKHFEVRDPARLNFMMIETRK